MPEEYITKGRKDCLVRIEFSDGTVAERERTPRDNRISIGDRRFERIGRDVPTEYFDLLGSTTLEYGDSSRSLCLATQFEGHFFITDSIYDRSRMLGAVCGIDIADDISSLIGKDERDAKAGLKFTDGEIATLSERLASISATLAERIPIQERLSATVSAYSDAHGRSDMALSIRDGLSATTADIAECSERVSILDRAISAYSNIAPDRLSTLIPVYRQISDIGDSVSRTGRAISDIAVPNMTMPDADRLSMLVALYDRLSVIREDVSNAEKAIASADRYAVPMPDAGRLSSLVSLYRRLSAAFDESYVIRNAIEAMDGDIARTEADRKSLMDGIDTCPLCGNPIHGHGNHI